MIERGTRRPARARRPDLSVIIPALNEAERLPRLLEQLRAQARIRTQIIVADGGSRDDTLVLARAAGAETLQTPPGRGLQMNAGARVARGDLLCFLHADSQLPDPQLLYQACVAMQAAGDGVAGHFALRFLDAPQDRRLFYRWLEAKSRCNRPGTIHGDQGFLLQRSFFWRLGGFPTALPVMEDTALAARVFDQGRWVLLPGTLCTSARRFEQEGWVQRYLLMGLMLALWSAQVPGFFTDARTLYPPPGEGKVLHIKPFLRLAAQELAALPACEQRRAYRRLARFLLGNAWQLPALVGCMRPGVLAAYDRWISPLTEAELVEALTGRVLGLTVGGLVWAS